MKEFINIAAGSRRLAHRHSPVSEGRVEQRAVVNVTIILPGRVARSVVVPEHQRGRHHLDLPRLADVGPEDAVVIKTHRGAIIRAGQLMPGARIARRNGPIQVDATGGRVDYGKAVKTICRRDAEHVRAAGAAAMLAYQYALGGERVGIKINCQRQGIRRRQQGRVVHLGAGISDPGGKVQRTAPASTERAAGRGPCRIIGCIRGAAPEVARKAVNGAVDNLSRPFVELPKADQPRPDGSGGGK